MVQKRKKDKKETETHTVYLKFNTNNMFIDFDISLIFCSIEMHFFLSNTIKEKKEEKKLFLLFAVACLIKC